MLQIMLIISIANFIAGNLEDDRFKWKQDERIVGGQDTSIEEIPWQVSIQMQGFHFCGGSIISENIILTAAHCTTSYPVEDTKVRVGSSKVVSGGTLHEVQEIVRHESYTTNIFGIPKNDIAILKLKSSIKFSKTTKPVLLFVHNEEAHEGSLSTISGWGTLSESGNFPEFLQKVEVSIVSKIKCDKCYWIWGGIPGNQICAAVSAGGKDTCQGDSGGPLVIDGRQAGIVSWGNGCARKGYPGVYTEIAAFRNWIDENVGFAGHMQI